MSYTIVIDVDNFRAERAFKKGLDELEEIWPQIESYCQKREAAIKTVQEKVKAEDARQWKVWGEREEKLKKEKEEWQAWKDSDKLFKGPEPKRPNLFDFNFPPPLSHIPKDHSRKCYESIRSRLKRMHTIANAAIGCYRMTENDVMEMAGWEDGSRIAKILQEIA